jgi:hypothetical protein
VEQTSVRPEWGFGGWKNLLAREATLFPGNGKTGTRKGGFCENSALAEKISLRLNQSVFAPV